MMSVPLHRARGAMLGLALGDAFGRPLEFMSGHAVRTRPVDVTRLRWTDDTHMSLYLGQAILDHGPGPLVPHRFGDAVGRAFAAWLVDPLTPTTAPGGTCLRGARAFAQSGDWTTSGDPHSDGCGAVMRIAPLALRFEGGELVSAARISARVTHAHPNAIEAAIAGAWLLRAALTTGTFGRRSVEDAIAGLRGPWAAGGTVAASLVVALKMVDDTGEWLDEAGMPPGDGGWRSGSALGLAVAAALRWGHDPALAMEKAARINGDSDSVACLVGMLLGGAGGETVLPARWLAGLQDARQIGALAARLVDRTDLPWVAVSDLHGHARAFAALLAFLDAELGEHYRLCTLGDYVDQGPEIPALLDLLIETKARLGDRFVPVLGNHDLALLRSLGWPGDAPDARWYRHWSSRYWNLGGSTAAAYGARSASELKRRMPAEHKELLESMPWCHDTGTFLFVHAGMAAGPLAPQVAKLRARTLPQPHLALPPPLRDKRLTKVADQTWDRVVVSAHNGGLPAAGFVAPKRVVLCADTERTGRARAMLLPQRRLFTVDVAGRVDGLGR